MYPLANKKSGVGKGLVLHRNAVGVLKEVMLQGGGYGAFLKKELTSI